jgi:two-component system sensor histidine kinase ChiS
MSDCILIVEDEPATLDVLRLFLEHEGYEVAGAREGGEALAFLGRCGPPALILLDLAMAGMDGRGFMDALAHHPEWSGVPVVVLTGDPDVSAAEAHEWGADVLLRKPVAPEELLATVDRYSWRG